MAYLDKNGLIKLWDKIKDIIPTKTSDLQNDSGFITGYTESDPTVPNHVKNITQTNISSWNNKANVSDIPTKTSELTNDSNFSTFSGNYNDLTNKPTIPTDYVPNTRKINNKALSSDINLNASDVGALPNTTTIPTKVSELTNDSGFTSNAGTITGITMNGASKGTSGVVNLGNVITEHQDISGKQDTLVSGTNIKTINNQSLLGSGNISISGGGGTSDYSDLTNKPKINNVELSGNKTTSDLNISYNDLKDKPNAPFIYNDPSVSLPSSVKIVPTLTHGGHQPSYGGCYYYKINQRVHVHVGVNGLTANTLTTIFTLPAGYRPSSYIGNYAAGGKATTSSLVQIGSNGDVMVRSTDTFSLGEVEFDIFE